MGCTFAALNMDVSNTGFDIDLSPDSPCLRYFRLVLAKCSNVNFKTEKCCLYIGLTWFAQSVLPIPFGARKTSDLIGALRVHLNSPIRRCQLLRRYFGRHPSGTLFPPILQLCHLIWFWPGLLIGAAGHVIGARRWAPNETNCWNKVGPLWSEGFFPISNLFYLHWLKEFQSLNQISIDRYHITM